ncbi:hypothetical protein D8674_031520 [Pyrus ussuriensis x Pyrus communis]|uniref:DUF674 domain-containing protein n=1 Tax=Pyrus ussuriensis x Pyrus communis TaxID=2448454 RepID=A0A5N5F4F0_9ROSA|nr:hypothetical protein D8674_031520 [Pyrus ussuriensis x Pyrus communis]
MKTPCRINVGLKLLVDTKGHKVLFAEATKEVVDFLFTLLSLPVATVIRLLSKNDMVGCLGQLCESVENLTTTLSGEGGYVKGVVTYMIMDNLEVKPMSTISSISVLNRFNIKEVGVLEEKVLLKASLESNTVLTNVFLGKKKT